jgi:hypothetical protein
MTAYEIIVSSGVAVPYHRKGRSRVSQVPIPSELVREGGRILEHRLA